jgi:bifunctional DNA-binding transcriptional regulator/antitoxin component of YhaV-PrlF toxin-antitoxin module
MEEVPFTLSPVLTAFLSLFFVVLLGAWLYVFYQTTPDEETDAGDDTSPQRPDDLLPDAVRERLNQTPVRRAFNLGPDDVVEFDPSEFERDDVFDKVAVESDGSSTDGSKKWPPSLEEIERERKTAEFDWNDVPDDLSPDSSATTDGSPVDAEEDGPADETSSPPSVNGEEGREEVEQDSSSSGEDGEKQR